MRSWPQETTPVGSQDQPLVEFEFTPQTLDWIERQTVDQERYIEDLDKGLDGADPGYGPSQVYLLHVMRGIVAQREEAIA